MVVSVRTKNKSVRCYIFTYFIYCVKKRLKLIVHQDLSLVTVFPLCVCLRMIRGPKEGTPWSIWPYVPPHRVRLVSWDLLVSAYVTLQFEIVTVSNTPLNGLFNLDDSRFLPTTHRFSIFLDRWRTTVWRLQDLLVNTILYYNSKFLFIKNLEKRLLSAWMVYVLWVSGECSGKGGLRSKEVP